MGKGFKLKSPPYRLAFLKKKTTTTIETLCKNIRLQNERQIIFEPKVWSECKNGEGEFSPHAPCGRVRLARFTLEDHAYGALGLPKRPKTTALQSKRYEILNQPLILDPVLIRFETTWPCLESRSYGFLFKHSLGSSHNLPCGKEDCVMSPNDICIGGYRSYDT